MAVDAAWGLYQQRTCQPDAAAVVSLERSGLWAFVVRTLQGQEKERGR